MPATATPQNAPHNVDQDTPKILPRDRVENFHGQQLLYVLWERHLVICAPIALAVPPDLPFHDLVQKILPTTVFARHPDWQQIDWNALQWTANGQVLQPAPDARLSDLGLTHKTLLRMRTPGLNGLGSICA